eukprot:scaffold26277_cov114-Isochrysis_galbana.AAC.5
MPAIGPTAECWWHGCSVSAPDAANLAAASASSAQPSSSTAPMMAPCIGPHMSWKDATGGPAWRMVLAPPAKAPTTSRAGSTALSIGCTPAITRRAEALASATSGDDSSRSAAARAAAGTLSGGAGRSSGPELDLTATDLAPDRSTHCSPLASSCMVPSPLPSASHSTGAMPPAA